MRSSLPDPDEIITPVSNFNCHVTLSPSVDIGTCPMNLSLNVSNYKWLPVTSGSDGLENGFDLFCKRFYLANGALIKELIRRVTHIYTAVTASATHSCNPYGIAQLLPLA